MFCKEDRVLILGAHPDDEVIGCGGTIARFAKAGATIHVGFFADGVTSRDHPIASPTERMREAGHAKEILGIEHEHFMSLRDQMLERYPLGYMADKITHAIQSLKPTHVFTHLATDFNQDHRRVYEATLIATRPFKADIEYVLGYPIGILSFDEWPNFFVDIGDFFDTKVEAMRAYASELEEAPMLRSPDGLKIIAQAMGQHCGRIYAEGFKLLRGVI